MKKLLRIGAAVATLVGVALLPLVGGSSASAATPAAIPVATPYLASVAMASTPDGGGYWLVGLDGGVFSFGDAGFYGSLPGIHVSVDDIVGITATPEATGTGSSALTVGCSPSVTRSSTDHCRASWAGPRRIP